MKRSWMFLTLVAILAMALPLAAHTTPTPAPLDPAYLRVLEQEQYVMAHPEDQDARVKLIDYATSPADGKALIIVGIGKQDKGRHPKQALAMAERAAQADVYRWLAYHALWQKDPSIQFGSVEATVNQRGAVVFQGTGETGDVILIQRFPYPLKVTVTPRVKPTPTPSPTPMPSLPPIASPSPETSPMATSSPMASPMATMSPMTSPTPMASPSAKPSPTAMPATPAPTATPVKPPTPIATPMQTPTTVPGPTSVSPSPNLAPFSPSPSR